MKQKIIKNTIVIILITIFITACCKTITYEIAEENRMVYQIGDTIIYKSNWNNLDTFVCTERENNYNNSEQGRRSDCPDEKYEYIYIVFKCINDSTFKSNKYSNGVVFFEYGNRTLSDFGFKNIVEHNTIIDTTENDLFFYNMKFTKIIAFTETEYINTDSLINILYFNYKYGAIQYNYYSGEIFKLYKLIPNHYETENN